MAIKNIMRPALSCSLFMKIISAMILKKITYLRRVVMWSICNRQDFFFFSFFFMEPLKLLIVGPYQAIWIKVNVAVSGSQVRLYWIMRPLKVHNMDYNQNKIKIDLKSQPY